uniref:Rsad2 n=1 Tax=Coccidioides posadasii RMSCC 3488 TaxID=454284 RepID=A0A0J6FIR8_COCPO|nr:Rsad2 [Coccidioides posadasii RMSCC 3488]
MLPEEDAKRGLKKLVEAGMKKLNVAWGESFLHPVFLDHICQYIKETLHLESISIVTNSSKVTKKWLQKYRRFINIIAVSSNFFDKQTNIEIRHGSGDNVQQLCCIKEWCQCYDVKFKMNTVVCSLNWQENMSKMIEELDPFQWKCFQVLLVGGENDKKSAKGQGKLFAKFAITDEQFESFCHRHRHLEDQFIPESNAVMAKSYLLLDEYMRFMDKGNGVEKTSESILKVTVTEALSQVKWDVESFKRGGGIYDWQRVPQSGGNCGTVETELDW